MADPIPPATPVPLPSTQEQERTVDEIPSLCMTCHEEGTTRLLLTRIPFFREIILMSFSCPHCGLTNNEIQSAGEIQQRGVRYIFKATQKEDLARQVVKSDTAVLRVEEMDLEIPPGRGQLSNLEGLLSMIREDLGAQQPKRQELDAGLYSKIEEILQGLEKMLSGARPTFTITLDDPAGNSSIEPSPRDGAGKYTRREYPRNKVQNAGLGLAPGEQVDGPVPNPAAAGNAGANNNNAAVNGTTSRTAPNTNDDGTTAPPPTLRPEYHASNMTPSLPSSTASHTQNYADLDRADLLKTLSANAENEDLRENEVYTFPSTCPGCQHPCATNMKFVRIPHFDEVVIMSTVCDSCGYRSNEVKSGGAVPEKGRRITLDVRRKEDLSRDILKAESCALRVEALSLTVEPGTLGGRFTTVEGLLSQVRDDLRASIFDTGDASGASGMSDGSENLNNLGPSGDSMPPAQLSSWTSFFSRLDRGISGSLPFTVVLEDPLAASYVQSFTAPRPDPQIVVEEYERTEEEEEELGLRDMRLEGYGEGEGEDGAGGGDGRVETVEESGGGGGSSEQAEAVDTEEVQREVRARLAALATDDD